MSITTTNSIINQYDNAYVADYYAWSPFYPLAARDLRVYNGDQFETKDKEKLFKEGRNATVCNIVRPKINWLTGYEKTHKTSAVCMPVESSDQQACDDWTEILLYIYQHSNGNEIESDCFAGAAQTGWNLETVWLDYRDDPVNGDIKFGRVPYSGFITSPYFTNLDFSDCDHVIMRKYLPVDQAASLLPKHKKEVYELAKFGWSRDDKFPWLPYQQQPNGQELIAYNEFYQQKWKNVDILVDMQTGKWTDWKGTRDHLEMYRDMFPDADLEIASQSKRYIEKHIILNDHHIKTETNPYGLDEYPFAPFVYQFSPEAEVWQLKIQSMVRPMIGPQYEANIMRLQMLDIINSQINSGWIAEQDSVINPTSLYQTSQGRVVWAKKGQMASIQRLEAASVPESSFALTSLFDGDINTVVGMNDAMGGIVESGNESGLMMQIKQGAALVGLQDPFDYARRAKKYIASKIIKLVQTWKPEKIERILGRRPTEQFFTKDFVKFDVNIVEGMHTDSQKMLYFRQLLDLKQVTDNPATGSGPITPDMLVAAAPMQGKSELNKQIEANFKASQEQAQAQQQQAMQMQQTQQALVHAQTMNTMSQAKKNYTDAVANLGLERYRDAEATEKRAQATLDRAKASKELMEMDENQLMRVLSIARVLEETDQRKEQRDRAEHMAISSQAMEQSIPDMNQPQQGLQQMEQI